MSQTQERQEIANAVKEGSRLLHPRKVTRSLNEEEASWARSRLPHAIAMKEPQARPARNDLGSMARLARSMNGPNV